MNIIDIAPSFEQYLTETENEGIIIELSVVFLGKPEP
jgi:hypothetical protein